jgi:dTDP-D-glucose 4,6-dehydratase
MCVHGSGTQLRSYLYVHDVVLAYDLVMHKGEAGEIYNLGTSSERAIVGVATDICTAFNLDPVRPFVVATRHMHRL